MSLPKDKKAGNGKQAKSNIEVRRDIGPMVLLKKARTETDGGIVARLFEIANIEHVLKKVARLIRPTNLGSYQKSTIKFSQSSG